MGTSYHVTVVAPISSSAKAQLQGDIDQALLAINKSMSTYIGDSELSLLNRSDVDQWQPLSDDLFDVLLLSEQINQLSRGAFDITVGPLVNLWGFGPTFTGNKVPSQSLIEATLRDTGAQYLVLSKEHRKLRRQAPVTLDLSAVAKGYGVDKVAELLEDNGYNDYLVEIGGEIRVSGRNKANQAWRIGIERPVNSLDKLVQKAVSITDMAVATSGDYRNFFELDGKRYSHTIDPHTGYPVEHNLVSVTVLDPLCAKADALATAFNVMGYKQALLLANSQAIAAFFIIHTENGFTEYSSEAFKARVPL